MLMNSQISSAFLGYFPEFNDSPCRNCINCFAIAAKAIAYSEVNYLHDECCHWNNFGFNADFSSGVLCYFYLSLYQFGLEVNLRFLAISLLIQSSWGAYSASFYSSSVNLGWCKVLSYFPAVSFPEGVWCSCLCGFGFYSYGRLGFEGEL